jgi:hypothetical protein
MRLTESTIRRIIKEESKRALNEQMLERMDPVGLVERYMTDIEGLFKGGYDPDDAKLEASDMIDDLCENLKDSMHNWLMDYVRDEEMSRAEYANDMEGDR